MRLYAYRRTIRRAIDFLLEQQNADGSMYPVEEGAAGYYKVPYAFSLAGESEAGLKLLSWVRENNFAADGDFCGQFRRLPPHEFFYHYTNAWLICGAAKLAQFDLAHKGVERLVQWQHPSTGGFLTMGPASDPDGEQDIMSTGAAGLACLYTGRLDSAVKVGENLRLIYDGQPSIDDSFYFVNDGHGKLVREWPEDKEVWYVIRTAEEKQWYFECGLAALFLTGLYRATGSEEWLELARKYLDWVERCADDRYATPQSGKVGWGAAALYAVTGEDKYRDVAATVADYLCDSQDHDGSWINPALESPARYVVMDVTAEFAVLLSEIVQGLTAGQ
jgi:hypothetical protein